MYPGDLDCVCVHLNDPVGTMIWSLKLPALSSLLCRFVFSLLAERLALIPRHYMSSFAVSEHDSHTVLPGQLPSFSQASLKLQSIFLEIHSCSILPGTDCSRN